MQILLEHLGKRFRNDWIVRDLSIQFSSGKNVAILGPNGSGKSTLLKLIASFYVPSEGSIVYRLEDQEVPEDQIFQYLSYAAPYMELNEHLTLLETITYHIKFKPFFDHITIEDAIHQMDMEKHQHKSVKSLSSGMKMRLRLALAIFSNTPILLLDEPLSNLDRKTKDWYGNLMQVHAKDRLVIVCSNHLEEEYFFCEEYLDLTTGKLSRLK